MKLAMFTTKDSLVAWYQREIEAIRNNRLKAARYQYEAALRGEGKETWMKFNNIPLDDEEAWNNQVNWLAGQVECLERKIKKYQRIITQNG